MNKEIEICCFTLRDFSKTGGGSIRISGILNALSKQGVRIHLYSLYSTVGYLDDQIDFVQLPEEAGLMNKRAFQLALSVLPVTAVNVLFRKKLQMLREAIHLKHKHLPFIFFEYLDNSIAYWLKKNTILDNYLNDIHGIVPLEFKENATGTWAQKVLFKLKELSAIQLDKKTLQDAEAIIYPSEGVKEYFENKLLSNNTSPESIVVPEAINELLLHQEADPLVKQKLIDTGVISEQDTIIMFIGDFKPFGGVEDLFEAFVILLENERLPNNTKLVLIGDGQQYDQLCKRTVQSGLEEYIKFPGRVPYEKLYSYQNVADILVCPDRDTTYSQLLPHIKYFDSISSGKVVVHGKFKFSSDVNPDEKYSVDFEPSNVKSLASALQNALTNLSELSRKAEMNSKEARNNFRYEHSIDELYNYLQQ